MSNILYSSSFCQSGYGNAAKDTCYALIKAGLPISTNVISTPMSRYEVAACHALDEIIKRASNKKVDVSICEQVPILWGYGHQKGSYKIGRIFWECDLLPDDWVEIINKQCEELWVPCEWNKQACINSKVKVPIYIIPPVSNFNVMPMDIAKKTLPIGGNPEAYRFYSIFQWSERKNGDGLLRAYFNEFSEKDNVMLVLKSYGASVSIAEKRVIKETVLQLKENSGNPSPPPVYFFGELLNPNEIISLHAQCHCYVSPHRGEGWSIPIAEAMANKKQVVTTKIGGITDLLDNNSAYIIPNEWQPVTGMPWAKFYNSNMKWGSISDAHIQMSMRQAYNDYKHGYDTYQYRIQNYDNILKLSNENNVVELIKERLAKINEK